MRLITAYPAIVIAILSFICPGRSGADDINLCGLKLIYLISKFENKEQTFAQLLEQFPNVRDRGISILDARRALTKLGIKAEVANISAADAARFGCWLMVWYPTGESESPAQDGTREGHFVLVKSETSTTGWVVDPPDGPFMHEHLENLIQPAYPSILIKPDRLQFTLWLLRNHWLLLTGVVTGVLLIIFAGPARLLRRRDLNSPAKAVLLLALICTGLPACRQEPARSPSANSGPRLSVESETVDLGIIDSSKIGIPIHHEFRLKNTGSAPLRFLGAKTSCSCTVADKPKDLNPGETGGLKLVVTPKTDAVGKTEVSVGIVTNESERPRIFKVMFECSPPVAFTGNEMTLTCDKDGVANGEVEVLFKRKPGSKSPNDASAILPALWSGLFVCKGVQLVGEPKLLRTGSSSQEDFMAAVYSFSMRVDTALPADDYLGYLSVQITEPPNGGTAKRPLRLIVPRAVRFSQQSYHLGLISQKSAALIAAELSFDSKSVGKPLLEISEGFKIEEVDYHTPGKVTFKINCPQGSVPGRKEGELRAMSSDGVKLASSHVAANILAE